MNSKNFVLFTRTPLHVGAGASVGIVDLPIIRESHTGYPVIPGTSLKGVLADLWNGELEGNKRGKDSDVELLFGADTEKAKAGKLLIGESKVVAFPVRSAKGGFAWVTCPLALGRLYRDLGKKLDSFDFEEDMCYASSALQLEGSAILEEYSLEVKDDVPQGIVDELKDLCKDELWHGELSTHLAIVSDEMFKYFVENTCEIAQHVKIDDESGTAEGGALFNQENVPAETLFFTVLYENADGCFKKLEDKLASVNNLIQVGADATTGLGWCSVNLK
ncbi:MAG: type III-B CRISPR module RAMP protein Cmr4 [Victivallales bacterium]|nr:type III-B CRISPR module RAMP protein Cmr4 [Victivallales bacterium]